jgi:hypothetical protein
MENPFRQENFKQAKIKFSDFGGVFGFAMARYTIHAFSGNFCHYADINCGHP